MSDHFRLTFKRLFHDCRLIFGKGEGRQPGLCPG
jgi:hypothetical protein